MKILLAFFIAVMFVGCATIPQGSSPSSSPLVSGNGQVKPILFLAKLKVLPVISTLFGFIPFGRTNIEKAINEAIENITAIILSMLLIMLAALIALSDLLLHYL